jgi:hypothetical protein
VAALAVVVTVISELCDHHGHRAVKADLGRDPVKVVSEM